MRRTAKSIWACVPAVCMVVALSGCSGIPGVFTVESAGTDSTSSGTSQKLDPTAYVDSIWESQVVPAATDKSVDLAVLMPALAADTDAASTEYGLQPGSGAPYAFLVKGSGTVTDVSKGDAVGYITVDVPGVEGVDVALAIGPAFVSTAIRDSMDFITFNQFTNQLEYAAVSTALNAKVKSTVVNDLDPSALIGKQVDFTGSFQLIDPTRILITPITLTVSP